MYLPAREGRRHSNQVKFLGQPLSQKKVFENLGPEPPTLEL